MGIAIERTAPSDLTTKASAIWRGVRCRLPRFSRTEWLWLAFAGSVVAATGERIFGGDGLILWAAIGLLGSVSCGWSWLLARSLFRPGTADGEVIPVMVVLGVMALQFIAAFGFGLASDVVAMVGSTFMVLGLVEAVRHAMGAKSWSERRFSILYALGFSALVLVSIVWITGTSDREMADRAAQWTGLVAVAGGWIAMRYRVTHPFPAVGKPAKRDAAAPEDQILAARVATLLEDQAYLFRPGLKVEDVATALGQPAYRVSRAVTGALGQANFNRYVNGLRIAQAQEMLRASAYRDQSILSIALDCGFGSIGPFNRAFKDVVGETPSQFRRGGGR